MALDEIYTSTMLISIITFVLSSALTPGPNNIMLLSSGLTFGYKKTIAHMIGTSIGFPLMVVLIGFGLGIVFKTFPILLDVIKYMGILYLFWMAYKIATNVNTYDVDENKESKPFTFFQAALFQWVNPKAWIMAITAISVYVTSKKHSITQVLIITFIFFIGAVISTNIWTLGGVVLKRFIKNYKWVRIINILLAILLILSIIPVILEK